MTNHVHSASETLDRKLAFSIGLNALIVIVEVAGGVVSGSLALLSDALHNLTDVAALTVGATAGWSAESNAVVAAGHADGQLPVTSTVSLSLSNCLSLALANHPGLAARHGAAGPPAAEKPGRVVALSQRPPERHCRAAVAQARLHQCPQSRLVRTCRNDPHRSRGLADGTQGRR
jgi:hypothetical protein